ncbi:MAG: acyl-CoA reductase, partial [Flavobacteriales bacterium]|nr:acyl-CoA reductase [Flavobacteriales bacterium]
MVSFQQRKSMWIQLGKLCRLFGRQAPWTDYSDGITETEYIRFNSLIETVKQENGWFTPESVRSALSAWGDALEADKLEQWLSAYTIADQPAGKTVAVIGAGNIPFVAMHDILCAVVSGHRALVKYASDDRSLI